MLSLINAVPNKRLWICFLHSNSKARQTVPHHNFNVAHNLSSVEQPNYYFVNYIDATIRVVTTTTTVYTVLSEMQMCKLVFNQQLLTIYLIEENIVRVLGSEVSRCPLVWYGLAGDGHDDIH